VRYTLGEIAARCGLELHGDAALVIEGICTMAPGESGRLAFLANPRLRPALGQTRASAILLAARDLPALPAGCAGLVAANVQLAYARLARLFDPDAAFAPGCHPSAVVSPDAVVGEGSWIGPQAVIESGARIGARCYVGASCFVGHDAVVGEDSRLTARVYVGPRVVVGARCHAQPGAVIGSRGFGNAPGPAGWEEVPQLGSVRIGNDVEIGANTTIDRGAIDDTVIEDGVKLDNQIQIAHNCRIGAHTAIAACTGIAGSTRIGARCMIGGAVGIAGHIEIADDVVILAMAMVTKGLPEKGVYGSGIPVAAARDWRKQIARLRRLENTEARLMAIEQQLGIEPRKMNDGDADE
jgi:UDP-3-O-[3-hydroxymyristoyl] glucosamine N-acyltransferase